MEHADLYETQTKLEIIRDGDRVISRLTDGDHVRFVRAQPVQEFELAPEENRGRCWP